MRFAVRKTELTSSDRLAVAYEKNEWFYRTRFEQSGDMSGLLEYGLSPSAWQSSWFREVVRTKIIAFLQCCNSRGISLGKIAKWLNAHAPSPPRGKAWHKSTVGFLLYRAPASDEETNIRTLARLLKGFGWAERNRQPGLDWVIESSESTEECARRVWDMHRLLLPAFQALAAYLDQSHREHELIADRFQRNGTRMHRRGEFGLNFLGTPSLKPGTLRDISQQAESSSKDALAWVVELEELNKAVPGFLDFQPSKFDMELIGQHRAKEALLRILCKLEGISTRTTRRYRDHCVQ